MTHARPLLLLARLVTAGPAAAQGPAEQGTAALAAALRDGTITAEAATAAALDRVAALDRAGPSLHAVLALNPRAADDARALDAERAARGPRGALHGVPVLVKDNIETADPVATTAGSLALAANVTGRDAPLVARLRAAGAVILGKANLSEWANIRGSRSVSGWSAVGGLTRNPYALDRSACGSSSGSAVAVAAGMVSAAIGTETDGSITCPASLTGIVGLKPTLGLVSRARVVPISHSQDTAGPMARTVRDAALVLGAIAGSDPLDPATRDADAHRADYLAALDPDALRGARLGVLRPSAGFHPETDAVFERALQTLRDAGAVLVEIDALPGTPPPGSDEVAPQQRIADAENLVLMTELKADLNAYLADAAPAVTARTLAAVIAFNEAHAAEEMPLFGQELFLKSEAGPGLDDPGYRAALATSKRLAGPDGIDRMLAEHRVEALLAPTMGPAWVVDAVNGDHASGSTSTLPAVAGTPHLTVPMGAVSGLPVGLSIMGPAWSDARVLALGYAFEQRAGVSLRPTFAASVP
ncbi:MAG: amidase [Janthinobacterium lividum]